MAGMDESQHLKAETKKSLVDSWLGWVEDPTLRRREFSAPAETKKTSRRFLTETERGRRLHAGTKGPMIRAPAAKL